MVTSASIATQYEELLATRRALEPTLSQKLFTWSLLGLKIHSWVMLVEEYYGGVPHVVKYVLALFFLFSMFYMLLRRPLTLKYYGGLAPAILIFSIYSLILVAQSFRFETRYLQFVLAAKYYVMPFFFPVFILMIRFDIRWFKYVMSFSLKFLPVLLLVQLSVLAMMNQDLWQEHLFRMHMFNFGLPLVLLNMNYLIAQKWQRNLLLLYFLLLVVIGSIYGRRGYVLDIVFLLAAYYALMSLNRVVSIKKKVRAFVLVLGSVMAFIFALGFLKDNLYIFQRGFDSDAWDETRGSILIDFFADFGTVAGDWIWGRGLDGTVLRSMNEEEGGVGNIIENGYLFTLLKAGGLYLLLMVLIFLWSAFLAFFRSRNYLVKSFATILVLHLVIMVAFNLPVFSSEYVVVWICVVLCNSSELRKLSDEEVKLILNV